MKQLDDGIYAASKHPALLATFKKAGLDPVGGTPEALGSYQAAEIAKWTGVVMKRPGVRGGQLL